VVTAHGQDVANLTEYPFVRPPARRVVKGAAAVIAVSEWLRGRLVASIGAAAGKTEVVNCGVDLERFRPLERTPGPSPAFLCVGSLIERKNVVRLANAFGRLNEGTLTFVGDGPLRPALEGRAGVSVTGYIAHDAVPGYLAAADVLCQPSLVEPFGQAALEALASGRNVVATRIGGPPEFVPPGAGLLVDPLDEDALVAALRDAAALPVPSPAAREAAEQHDLRRQAARVEAILDRAVRDRRA
jgi:glycosyltransferase involved in cell wall biosynthesis